MADDVNHPCHYTAGKIEVIDYIEDQGFGYHAACIVKYVSRYRYKGTPLKDLQKARWYLDRLIGMVGQEQAFEKEPVQPSDDPGPVW